VVANVMDWVLWNWVYYTILNTQEENKFIRRYYGYIIEYIDIFGRVWGDVNWWVSTTEEIRP